MDEILQAFIEDAQDLLAAMESGLLLMEQGTHTTDTINSIFRAAHTIKGDAGIVELLGVQQFAHVLEDSLALLRDGTIVCNTELVHLLLLGCDHIKALVADAADGKPVPDAHRQAAGAELATALRAYVEGSHHTPELPSALTLVEAPTASTTAFKSEASAAAKGIASKQVRVQAEKLDQLLDLVGEMVSSSAAALLRAKKSGQTELIEANSGLVLLVEAMRELSNQLRMVRVGEVFNRFKRVTRDMAREMQRDIDLVIRGEDAELDKSVVEKIGDPLTHLLRNAIDHGIEAEDVRLACGKPVRGTITLSAYHEPGGVVIEVSDDGAGLNAERIFATALERGLVSAGQVLTHQEMIDLIFLPGFSTAATVSSISGRGVGMDVVRSNIVALRGSVEVQTEPGVGSRFLLHLPLTMAIIDGFMVGVGTASYIIPLELVVECIALQGSADASHYLDLRGHALPLLALRQCFANKSERPKHQYVVVVKWGDQLVGLVVDQLHGEQQTVIKPLPALFHHLPGIAGSTILSTGAVGLILDVPSLMSLRGGT